ncbi:MAG: acetylglutamate kinase [Phototrophicaceae bacterium]
MMQPANHHQHSHTNGASAPAARIPTAAAAAPVVVKIGGHEIADVDFLSALAATISQLNTPAIIIHGGGPEITQLQQLMGIVPRYVDGVRITDQPSLAVVEMVLAGVVNKRLVRHLVEAGVDAVGLSGVDRGLLRAVRMVHPSEDMGFTGQVTRVRGDILRELLAQGVTPVIAPVCLGEDRPVSYNVNADHVTGAVAAAVEASRVVFLTNVEGVLVNGQPAPQLDTLRVDQLIADGTIFGGMIPKVTTALDVLKSGVPQAVITNLTGLTSHGGTIFTV